MDAHPPAVRAILSSATKRVTAADGAVCFYPAARKGDPWPRCLSFHHRGAGTLKQGEFFWRSSLVQSFIPWDLKIRDLGKDLLLTVDNPFCDSHVAYTGCVFQHHSSVD